MIDYINFCIGTAALTISTLGLLQVLGVLMPCALHDTTFPCGVPRRGERASARARACRGVGTQRASRRKLGKTLRANCDLSITFV